MAPLRAGEEHLGAASSDRAPPTAQPLRRARRRARGRRWSSPARTAPLQPPNHSDALAEELAGADGPRQLGPRPSNRPTAPNALAVKRSRARDGPLHAGRALRQSAHDTHPCEAIEKRVREDLVGLRVRM